MGGEIIILDFISIISPSSFPSISQLPIKKERAIDL